MQNIRSNNADFAKALLCGEIDVNEYWDKSGQQQIKSAGVSLTEKQQDRALRNLARLAVSLNRTGFRFSPDEHANNDQSGAVNGSDLQPAFENYLATFR